MEITEQMAIDLGVVAGDRNMRTAGREVWTEEDFAVAGEAYRRLKPAAPVQKMDESEEAE